MPVSRYGVRDMSSIPPEGNMAKLVGVSLSCTADILIFNKNILQATVRQVKVCSKIVAANDFPVNGTVAPV
jgi:hypothetical protein